MRVLRKERGQELGLHLHTKYLVISWPVADAEHWFPILADEGSVSVDPLL